MLRRLPVNVLTSAARAHERSAKKAQSRTQTPARLALATQRLRSWSFVGRDRAMAFDPTALYGVIDPARLVPVWAAPAPAPAPAPARLPPPLPLPALKRPRPATPPAAPDPLDVLPYPTDDLRALTALIEGGGATSSTGVGGALPPPPLLRPLEVPVTPFAFPPRVGFDAPPGGDFFRSEHDHPPRIDPPDKHAGVLREEGGLRGWLDAIRASRQRAKRSRAVDKALGGIAPTQGVTR
jgi:hypothetical protein